MKRMSAKGRVIIAVDDACEKLALTGETKEAYLDHLAEGIKSMIRDSCAIWCYNRRREHNDSQAKGG